MQYHLHPDDFNNLSEFFKQPTEPFPGLSTLTPSYQGIKAVPDSTAPRLLLQPTPP